MNDLVIPPPLQRLRADSQAAGRAWAARPIAERLRVVRHARHAVAAAPEHLASTVARPVADTLVAEVLPLLDAARFLERRAAGLLAPRRLRSGRPLWLLGVRATLRREPLGAVLILAPGNYPLFLPGAQALAALVAGNAVAWKPAPGGEAAAHALASILRAAGLPYGTLTVLDPADGPVAARAGFDHIVLTGSAETGAAVLAAAAETLTPCTMELSGSDAVFILPGADIALVSRCLAYGLRLNGGATCIAPRRVFVPRAGAEELSNRLLALLPTIPDASVPAPVAARLDTLLDQARAAGATVHRAGPGRPTVVARARADLPLLQQDVFAPWLALVPVDDMAEALALDRLCPYALGASVFGPATVARDFAAGLRAGSVCVNDLIVPTADPRLSFGGTARSGFGRTRGAEGLLAMTTVQAISERRLPFRPHLAAPSPKDTDRFRGMIRVLHRPWFGARGLS